MVCRRHSLGPGCGDCQRHNRNPLCPNSNVTREQAATFLYRFVTEYLKIESAESTDLSMYKDADKISGYAKTAVAWATAKNLFEGFPNGTLQPKDTLTRAQLAKLLTILDQNF